MVVLLEWVGDMETDSRHQEICLLAVDGAKRNQRRSTHDDVDELEGLVNISVRKIKVEGRSVLQEAGVILTRSRYRRT